MKAYHGTTKENKENIFKNGFRLDTVPRKGRLQGHAIYLTTRKEWAKTFGDVIIEVEINKNDLKFFCDKDVYLELYESHIESTLSPYKSIEDFVYDSLRSIKGNFTDVLRTHGDSIYEDVVLRVGTALKKDLIEQGIQGFALLFFDKESEYYDITIYDTSLLSIIRD